MGTQTQRGHQEWYGPSSPVTTTATGSFASGSLVNVDIHLYESGGTPVIGTLTDDLGGGGGSTYSIAAGPERNTGMSANATVVSFVAVVAAAGTPTITIPWSGGTLQYLSVDIYETTGADTTTPIGAAVSAQGTVGAGSPPTHLNLAITTTQANSMMHASATTSGTSATAGTGYTQGYAQTTWLPESEVYALDNGSTGARNVVWDNAGGGAMPYTALAYEIRIAGGGGGGGGEPQFWQSNAFEIYNGPTVFTVTLAATLTESAALVRSSLLKRAASLTQSVETVLVASLNSAVGVATLTMSAVQVKAVGLIRSAIATLSAVLSAVNLGGGGGTTFPVTLAATLTESAAVQRAVAATRAASSTMSAAVVRQVGAVRAATETLSAAVVRQIGAIRSATLTLSATTATLKARFVTLAATLTQSAAVAKLVGMPRAVTLTTSAAVAKAISTTKAVTLTLSATAAALKARFVTLAVTLTQSAAVVRSVGAVRSVTVSASAVVVKAISTTKAVTLALTAAVARARTVTLSATLTTSATLQRAVMAVRTATVTASATIRRAIGSVRTAVASLVATITKQSSNPTVPGPTGVGGNRSSLFNRVIGRGNDRPARTWLGRSKRKG